MPDGSARAAIFYSGEHFPRACLDGGKQTTRKMGGDFFRDGRQGEKPQKVAEACRVGKRQGAIEDYNVSETAGGDYKGDGGGLNRGVTAQAGAERSSADL